MPSKRRTFDLPKILQQRIMLHTFEVKTGQQGRVDVLTLQKLEDQLQPQLPLVA